MKDVKMKTLVKYPFLGSIVAGVPLEIDNSRKTAATDGKKIMVNENFFNSLSSQEQVFLYAHEVLHIAFDHISRLKDKDIKLWNIATDAVINGLLVNDDLPMIEGGIYIKNAFEKTAEEVYSELLKQQNQNPNKDKNSQKLSGGQDSGNDEGLSEENHDVGHASHESWKDAIKTHKDEIEAKSHAIMASRATQAGSHTSSVARAISKTRSKQNVVSWKYLLRKSINTDGDWSYKEGYFENSVLLPNIRPITRAESEVLLDTSGSINDEMLKMFLSETFHILKEANIKIGCFDTEFYGFKEYGKRSLDSFTPVGGGGTDFDVAVEAFSKRAFNKIIFTDGEADMPKKAVNAIWVVVGDKKINPPGGKVINISEEELRKCKANFINSNERQK